MAYSVYILFSDTLQKYYVGHTEDVSRRLEDHNRGKAKFTSKGIPWKLIKVIACTTRSEAMLLENKIKKRGIKRYLQDHSML